MQKLNYSFVFDFLKLPDTVLVETKKGGMQPTKLTQELFQSLAELGTFQVAWNGDFTVTILAFDRKAHTARIRVDYSYETPDGSPISEDGKRESFRHVLGIFCECPDTYNMKLKKTLVYVVPAAEV